LLTDFAILIRKTTLFTETNSGVEEVKP